MPRCSKSPRYYSNLRAKTRLFGGSNEVSGSNAEDFDSPPKRSRGYGEEYYIEEQPYEEDAPRRTLSTWPDERYDPSEIMPRRTLSAWPDERDESDPKPHAQSRGKNLQIILDIIYTSFGIPHNIAEPFVRRQFRSLDV